MTDTSKITRVEVINHGAPLNLIPANRESFGMILVTWDCSVDLSLQDNGRTLKVFLGPRQPEGKDA